MCAYYDRYKHCSKCGITGTVVKSTSPSDVKHLDWQAQKAFWKRAFFAGINENGYWESFSLEPDLREFSAYEVESFVQKNLNRLGKERKVTQKCLELIQIMKGKQKALGPQSQDNELREEYSAASRKVEGFWRANIVKLIVPSLEGAFWEEEHRYQDPAQYPELFEIVEERVERVEGFSREIRVRIKKFDLSLEYCKSPKPIYGEEDTVCAVCGGGLITTVTSYEEGPERKTWKRNEEFAKSLKREFMGMRGLPSGYAVSRVSNSGINLREYYESLIKVDRAIRFARQHYEAIVPYYEEARRKAKEAQQWENLQQAKGVLLAKRAERDMQRDVEQVRIAADATREAIKQKSENRRRAINIAIEDAMRMTNSDSEAEASVEVRSSDVKKIIDARNSAVNAAKKAHTDAIDAAKRQLERNCDQVESAKVKEFCDLVKKYYPNEKLIVEENIYADRPYDDIGTGKWYNISTKCKWRSMGPISVPVPLSRAEREKRVKIKSMLEPERMRLGLEASKAFREPQSAYEKALESAEEKLKEAIARADAAQRESLEKLLREYPELLAQVEPQQAEQLAKVEAELQAKLTGLEAKRQEILAPHQEEGNERNDSVSASLTRITREREAEAYKAQIDKVEQNLKEFQKIRDKLLNLRVIHPKYLNFMAVTTMYEYLDTERCTELEGPHGAYNLYESEIRANRIIAQLDQALKALNAIQSNQCYTYKAIKATQSDIQSIDSGVRRMNDDVRKIGDSIQKNAAVMMENMQANKAAAADIREGLQSIANSTEMTSKATEDLYLYTYYRDFLRDLRIK